MPPTNPDRPCEQACAPAMCSRRTLLGSAGLATAGAVLLGACGAGQSGGGPAGGAPATTGPISEATIPVGGGRVFPDREIVVTQPTAGQFKAFSAICPHAGCTVSQVSGGTIDCPCHGSRFAVADGSVVQGPASQPLTAKKVVASGGNLSVS